MFSCFLSWQQAKRNRSSHMPTTLPVRRSVRNGTNVHEWRSVGSATGMQITKQISQPRDTRNGFTDSPSGMTLTWARWFVSHLSRLSTSTDEFFHSSHLTVGRTTANPMCTLTVPVRDRFVERCWSDQNQVIQTRRSRVPILQSPVIFPTL